MKLGLTGDLQVVSVTHEDTEPFSMTTSTHNAYVRRELLGIGSDLKWSSVELSRIAERLSAAGNSVDAQAIMRMIQVFQQGEAKLKYIADDVASDSPSPALG
ncbi:MAG: hypothetical protein ACOH2R_23475 [Pseudomonas sp.]